MKSFKLLAGSVILASFCLSSISFAADPAAKEDTTPPAAEGPLTAEQTPPINVSNPPATTPVPNSPAPESKVP